MKNSAQYVKSLFLFLFYHIKMKIDNALIQYINLFEKITRTRVKDCIQDNDKLIFIVEEGEISKALGKNGINIKKIASLTKKKLKVIDFNSKIERFIKNLINPVQAEKIEVKDNVVEIFVSSRQDKGLLIGRDRNNLKFLKSMLEKYFKVTEVRIV